jgi:hypothetical protein
MMIAAEANHGSSATSTRGDNLYFKYKMRCVRADMTDADLEQLSDFNSRMFTSLLGQRARLRNPNIDHFCRCWDEWQALMQLWRQTQDSEIWEQQERAHRQLMEAIDGLP